MRRTTLIALVALALVPFRAAGQEPQAGGEQTPIAQGLTIEQVTQRLAAYIETPEHQQQVVRSVMGLEQYLRGQCTSVNIAEQSKRELISPPVFVEGVVRPLQGMWKEQWKVDRCGSIVLYNLQFLAQPDRVPQVLVLVPGSTETPFDLQNRTSVELINVARQANTGCQAHLVANTERLTGLIEARHNEQNKLIGGYWKERWSVFSCGRTWSVDLRFEFQSDGTLVSKVES